MSLSHRGRSWSARTAGERKLDATVWGHGQLYVVAQGNGAESAFSDYGAAKNSLSVGAVHDTGGHATFTSVGPTADGRLAPQVAGTGVHVHSARGQGSPGGYERSSGTSMAAPSVAGVAALLMDALPSHRDNPALARARLMASAIRPDAWLEDPAAFPLDNTNGPGRLQNVYGMGKVSAHTAVLDGDNVQGWRSGSATAEPEDGEYAYVDIEVPAGASRLDLVLTWDEPPADTSAGSSVLNDLDLWLDRDADCGGARCGEHSSRSRVDNVEWIIVRDPEPGTYRAKVAAEAVYTAAPRAALAWTVIRGPSTPKLAMLTTPTERLPAGRTSEFRAVVSVDGYVAAGTLLRVDCFSGSDGCDETHIESVALADDGGVLRELEMPDSLDDRNGREEVFFGAWFSLGEVHRGGGGVREDVEVVLRVRAGADPATLRLVADSWNASAAVATVAVAGAPTANPARSANDDFAAVARIDGAEGSVDLSLSRATPEPGEPTLAVPPFVRRPAASVWYEWTATESAIYHFAVSRRDGAPSRRAHVGVYGGSAPASLRRIGESLGNVSFRAEGGRTYRVRVASYERVEPLELRWSSGRPANDDFADAELLDGATGEVASTTVGATLEPGESWGSLAGTVWYRWTAPEDGDWSFQGSAGGLVAGPDYLPRLLVFRGDAIGSLRLASTHPGHPDHYFTARAGEEFRIAAAATNPASAWAFDLKWSRTSLIPVDNDAFAEAWSLSGGSSSATVRVDFASTVEPAEPAETGVRTRWWRWDAPVDGRYTWRLEDRGEYPWRAGRGIPDFQVRAFRGESLGELDLLGGAGPFAPYEFAVDLLAGETLRISVGFAPDGSEAYDVPRASADLAWGPTPANDGVDDAPLLDSEYGRVSGSKRFATTDAGVRTDVVGRSAVWWTFEAPEGGWYRFSADGDGGPWALTVFDGDGVDATASSRWQRAEGDDAEVLFYAEAGSRHAISLGTAGGGAGGDFTLRWDTADPPLWLRYAGRLADGDRRREDGGPVEIRRPGQLAILPDGAPWRRSVLYLASGIGLSVFSRDPESGDLTLEQLAEGDLSRSHLAVDAVAGERSRLLAHDCGTWRSYGLSADGAARAPEDLSVDGDSANCGRILVDGARDAVWRVGEAGVDVFEVEEDGSLRFAATHAVAGLKGAVLGSAGRLYAVGTDGLAVLERDDGDGSLSATDAGPPLAVSNTPRVPLAIDAADERLYAVDDEGTRVFSLEDPLMPVRLARLRRSHRAHVLSWQRSEEWCEAAAIRGALAADVFCRNQTFTAEYRPDDGTLSETDRMDDRTPDRFNNQMPEFGRPVGLAASPDGRHVYVSTAMHGILVFERVATPEESDRLALPDGPDLVVVSASVDDPTPLHGRLFRFDATVRNRGSTGSDSSTLRFRRSSDATIDADDDEVAARYVRRLAAGDDADLSSSIRAPASAGTYYYGVCVDAVDEESDTANNCSQGVEIRVTAPDLVVVTPAVDDDTPEAGESFTLSVTVRNRGDGRSIGAGTVRYHRSADAEIATDDAEVGTDVVGSLEPGAESDESIRLTAPSGAGTYYYGACVDAVDGEFDTTNNCSTGVEVEVSDDDGGGGGSTDDHGDTFADSTSVAVPSTTDGELEEGGDRDYFSLVVDTATTLTVGTTGSTDTYGTLFDGNETSLETDDDGGAGTNFEIERDVDAGTYYVEVRGFSSSTTGAYELEVSADGGSGAEVFGAMAVDLKSCTDVPAGISLNHDTEQDALDAASSNCQDDGGSASECDGGIAFARCGVIVEASSFDGTRCFVIRYSVDAQSVGSAETAALVDCADRGHAGCGVLEDDNGEDMSGCNSTSSSSGATVSETATTTAVRSIRSASIDDR